MESLAHQYSLRIAHICAKNTSRLAYDGSGKVDRGRYVSENTPYDICRFSTGKLYHCDLNASYNIGIRYFLRAMLKALPIPQQKTLVSAVEPEERFRISGN